MWVTGIHLVVSETGSKPPTCPVQQQDSLWTRFLLLGTIGFTIVWTKIHKAHQSPMTWGPQLPLSFYTMKTVYCNRANEYSKWMNKESHWKNFFKESLKSQIKYLTSSFLVFICTSSWVEVCALNASILDLVFCKIRMLVMAIIPWPFGAPQTW